MSARSLPVKQLLSAVKKEMEQVSLKLFEVHQKKDKQKQEALLAYQKMQLIKSGKALNPEALQALAKLTQANAKPKVDVSFLDHIVTKDEAATLSDKLHMSDIATFLASQREYQDLLERYNPGLTMEQSDNVRKTANRVGLQIPE